MVFQEAMSCGKPVVSTLSGSIPEVVGDAGILAQPNDHLSLYHALRELIAAPDVRESLGAKGRQRVLGHFTIRHISENIRRAFRTILGMNG